MGRTVSLFVVFVCSAIILCGRSYFSEDFDGEWTIGNPTDSTLVYKIELGKQLFYDPVLSRDSTVSCSTCHKQELAFTDGLSRSIGIRNQEVSRNAPTLTNVGNRKHLLLDGVNPSLESQVGVPVQEHKEFDFNILLLIERLRNIEKYEALAQKAYGTGFTERVLLNSIAEFERTLISDDSPYDRFMKGDNTALTASQHRGRKLFFETLYCGKCHNGSDLTDERFTNNGLYIKYQDTGRMRLTEKEADRGIFKVPTLRNIAVTGPYMHDGSIKTLEDIVSHYASGGKPHKGKAPEIVPFNITKEETEDLVHFLEALTDSTFLTNPDFRLE